MGSEPKPLAKPMDFRNPDYAAIIGARSRRLLKLRANPQLLPGLKAYYKDHIADFVNDWGVTFDPRNVERGLPANVPFILFDKQREWIEWFIENWKLSRYGITEKSRDAGLSWLAISTSCALCLFHDGMSIGFGSRKEEYVDKADSPKSLFFKGRMFMSNLPKEFRGGFLLKEHAPHMRLKFPETNSYISGEAGDNIGRGDRTSIYIVDEAAHIERPELVDASLSSTTNCRQDISSVNGMGNSFAQKRFSGSCPVFTFHWRDDPRKDQAWYEKMCRDYSPVVVAQEIDINYSASVEGVLIPSAWAQAAIDAHIKLGLKPTGRRCGALDVADEGRDLNAFAGHHGIVVERIEAWSGVGDDIFGTVQKAFHLCDDGRYTELRYDSDGLGAGVRGDGRVINERRAPGRKISLMAFRGSEAVANPDKQDVRGRDNKDFFANRKAQAWWSLRTRFQQTFRAVVEGKEDVNMDEIISLPSSLPNLSKLCSELSQPSYSISTVGKIVIDKAPDGAKSPNMADALMIAFSGGDHKGFRILASDLAYAAGQGSRW